MWLWHGDPVQIVREGMEAPIPMMEDSVLAAGVRSSGTAGTDSDRADDAAALAFHHAAVALALVEPNGAVRAANPAFCRFLASDPESLRQRRLADLVHPEDREVHAAGIARLLAGEVARYERDHRYVRADGRVVRGQTTIVAVPAPGGSVAQAVCQVDPDPAPASSGRPPDRRQGDDELHLREHVHSLVSHEIRTPLTSIQGYSELLTGLATDRGEVAEFARAIHDEAVRLATKVDAMLLLDRLRSGALSIAPEPTDLNSAVRETVARFALTRPERAVALDLNPALPLAQADRGRFQQALGYLLANAAVRSPAGAPIAVRTRRERAAVCVAVIDGGAPIGLAAPGALHDRLELAELVLVRAGGAGLALAVVREIALRHGGRAWVEGIEGGCAFHLRLPSARRAA